MHFPAEGWGRAARAARRWRRAALIALAVVVNATLGWLFVAELHTFEQLSAPAIQADYRAGLDQRYCLIRLAHALLPRGASVGIGPASFETQIVAESIVGWAVPAVPSRAQWDISFQKTGGPCLGAGFQVRRR